MHGPGCGALFRPARNRAPGQPQFRDAGAYQYQSVAPSLPPSITVQPVSATVVNGNTATFGVVAIGTAPFSYQWQADGAPISGATSSTYATGAVDFSDDQTQFSVVVTNAQGSVTSSVATLHITDTPGELDTGTSTLNFGTVYSGATSSLAVTLTNNGNSNVDISNVGISGVGFGATGISSGLVIAPGESANLSVTFSPASAGNFTGSVTIASDASNSPLTISALGIGAAKFRARSIAVVEREHFGGFRLQRLPWDHIRRSVHPAEPCAGRLHCFC